MPKTPCFTIEPKPRFFAVYEFDVYPRWSPSKGKTRKTFRASYKTEAEAQAHFPTAQRIS